MEVVHVRNGNVATSDDVIAMEVSRVNEKDCGESTYSQMRIPVMGPKKMVYPPRKARNLVADARIFHGTKAQLPMKAASN